MGKKAVVILFILLFVAGYIFSTFLIGSPEDRIFVLKLLVILAIFVVIILVGYKITRGNGEEGDFSFYGD